MAPPDRSRGTRGLAVAVAVGCVAVPYWILYYVFVFGDLYFDHPGPALVLKPLFPIFLASHITGLIIGVISRKASGRRAILAVGLNGAPLILAVGFFWWLFFGVKI